ncbi:hypothetical protein GCM10010840_27090 [Deinococcus aerolatus]|uniref:Transposase n=1 Tax=Deinococcus aerolatus TaxID=522487 RepID=A0ABQ2GCZ8_9DEIO|nr:transposase [Deinococcus aerolatus]GGL87689.1 hypothetical protein GCM10010840_27090 [Deinococcus aerolatus]
MPGGNHSGDFKLKLVDESNAGRHTSAQLCHKHSRAPSLIHRWRKEADARGSDAPLQKRHQIIMVARHAYSTVTVRRLCDLHRVGQAWSVLQLGREPLDQ